MKASEAKVGMRVVSRKYKMAGIVLAIPAGEWLTIKVDPKTRIGDFTPETWEPEPPHDLIEN